MNAQALLSFFGRNWLKGLLALVVTLPLFVLAVAYWWLLPNLPQYKDTVARVLSAATGYTVTLEKIDGEWGGARPRVILEGVRLSDHTRPLLHFSRLEGRFGWRSLIALEPRFHDLLVSAPAVTLRRGADGLYYIGGLKIDPTKSDTAFSDWLLKQGAVHVDGATVAWIDEMSDGPPLVFRNVSFKLSNLLRRHNFSLTAVPPPAVAAPFTIEGSLHGSSLAAKNEWRGKVNARSKAVSLAAMRPWLPAAWAELAGDGSTDFAAEIDKGSLSAVEATLNMRSIHVPIDGQRQPLKLEGLAGKLGWKRDAGAQALSAQRVTLKPTAAAAIGPFDLAYQWGQTERAVHAKDIQLDSFVRLTGALPLTPAVADQLRATEARGRIDELAFTWQGELRAPKTYSIQARFSRLGWAANGHIPGVHNLSGMLQGNDKKGVYSLTGDDATIDLPKVFADPRLAFDILNIRGAWKKHEHGYTLEIAEAALANADVSAHVFGRYHWLGKGPGVADLNGRLDRAAGTRVERYLPLTLNEETHAWLRQGILRGDVSQATFQLQGDLARFPFHRAEDGIFKVAASIKDAQIHFASDYPVIDHVDGELRIDRVRLEVRSDKAAIYGARLNRVVAIIPDLNAHAGELLEVTGEASGPAQEFVRFANASPVKERISGLTETMTAAGPVHLLMNIKVPLRHSSNTTVAGRLSFSDNTLMFSPDLPRLEKVTGRLDFTDQAITTPRITANLLGGEAVFSAATDGSRVRVSGQGTMRAAALDNLIGKNFSRHLSGQTNWKGELAIGRDQTQIRLESNLSGLESNLPAPMSKSAAGAVPTTFEYQMLGQNEDWSRFQFGKVLSAVWTTQPTPAGRKLNRARLQFGDKAELPSEDGLQVGGIVRNLDLGHWFDLWGEGDKAQSLSLTGVDLTLVRLSFLDRPFHDITINGKLRDNLLRATIRGREMDGNVTYRLASDAPARLSLQFRRFVLPERSEGPPGEAIQLDAAELPVMDIQVEELKFGDQPLGRLDAIAQGAAKGLAIEKLNLSHSDSNINLSGLWNDTGKGETRMTLNAEVHNAGQMLDRFGYGDTLKRGTAQIRGEISWQGSPADFAFSSLDGNVKLTAKGGQFTKLRPGAGKLLGVISLQSLPRRLSLDFRDVFSEGFAFDEISSTMQLARGTVYTNDFLMKGPSAKVKMSGLANLQDESVKLRVKVIPKVSEGVAVAGALIGGPVAGLGALVMQKALKDPLEEAIALEYLVDGGWDNPAVTKLAKSRPKQEQAVEP